MASFSITALSSFFACEKKSLSRGENHFKSDHVESFSFSQSVLKGKVRASMKKKVYNVTVYLDYQNEIKNTECECPRGEFKCSHAAALFIYGIYNVSRTDVECTWRKRKQPENAAATSVAELFPPLKKGYRALDRVPTAEDRASLYSALCDYGKFTGLCWLMSPEPPPTQPLPILTISDIIYSEDFLQTKESAEQLSFLLSKTKMDDRLIQEVSQVTVGQRDNPLWHLARNGRLTASNFGSVLNAKRATQSLIKRLLAEYDVSRVKSVMWGVNNESEGIKSFTSQTGLPVEPTGIWLDDSGILGASPDGFVGKNHVLEIKCPYTARNITLQKAVESISTFCLEKDDSGTGFTLKKSHVYWHQVQGQMHISKRGFCFFVVWTTKETAVLTVKRDPLWANNIELLKDFYFLHIFPKIVEGEL